MSRIFDKAFKYVPAAKTNVAATFRRIRAEQKAKAEEEAKNAAEANQKTIPLKVRTA